MFTGPELEAIVIELLILALVIRRSYAMSQGVPYSLARLILAPALLVFLWLVSELESLLLIPWAFPTLVAVDLAVLVATAWAFAGVAEERTRVRRDVSGEWVYQIGFTISSLFIVAFLVRLGIAVALFPESLGFGAASGGGYPPFSQQFVLATVDAFLSVSVGLLVGRAWGVSRKIGAAARGATG